MKNLKFPITICLILMAYLGTNIYAQDIQSSRSVTPVQSMSPTPTDDCTANGENVTIVGFAHQQNSPESLGSFVNVDAKKWQEIGSKGVVANFEEQARDAWSVYLFDKSRDVYIQLDLHTKNISYAEKSWDNKRVQYQVLNASCKVNGRMACVVYYNNDGKTGVFREKCDKEWTELNIDGNKYNFQETGRDDWSVYLEDKSRNYKVALNLHTNKVMLGQIGEKLQYQYPIARAE